MGTSDLVAKIYKEVVEIMRSEQVRRWYIFSLVIVLMTVVLVPGLVEAQEERVVRELFIISEPQSSSPDEYETINLVVEAMQEAGINAVSHVIPWEQKADVVWYERDRWDMSGWQMTARPERLDPDEFTYNLFHSSLVEDGYNFVGYKNTEYDEIAENQRVTIDLEERQKLIHRTQEIIAEDAVYNFTVHPEIMVAYNNQEFDPDSITELAGLGVRNFWTYVNVVPTGNNSDIRLNSNNEIQAINPLFISGTIDSWVTELVYDRLMRMSPDGLPEPWAAESVEWLDDTSVEVVIRENMYFHDGEPVTIEDVKYSFEVPFTGQVPMYRPFVDIIEDIEVVDDQTLVFHLERPYAPFETATLAKMNIIPKHVWEPIIEGMIDQPENAESYQEEVPVGSGPFEYSHWARGDQVILTANTDHFHSPQVERWILRVVPNMEAALGMIQSGELNFLSEYIGDRQLLSQIVEQNEGLNLSTGTSLGFRFLAFNHNRPPFDDVAFRRAVVALTDRDLISQLAWRGFADDADSVISPALDFWKNTDLDYSYGGVEEARRILAEAGYEWDEEGRLLYPEGQVEETEPSF